MPTQEPTLAPLSTRSGLPDTSRQAILAGHEKTVFPCVAPYYREPIVMDRGEGVWVWDHDGTEYLDFFSGILTTSVGHCHPGVNDAVKRQIDHLGHTSTLYLTGPQVRAADKLIGISPGELSRCFFTNSGTEAIETAIMAARLFTNRHEVIALRYAYHGRSLLATTLTAHGAWRPLESSLSGITHARAPYGYRTPERGLTEEEAGELFAQDLEEVIATCTSGRPAAFIAETVLGVGGYLVPPLNYFRRAAEIVRRHGGLLIIDEVQAGLGRSGTWFAIEQWGVSPDIMVLAKGIANGYPASATLATEEVAQAWTAKTISTYGGNPISMAATEATLTVMIQEDVPARSRARGRQLRAGLEELGSRYPWVGEVRGLGLMQALELVEDEDSRAPSRRRAATLLEAAKDQGLLIGLAGVHDNVVRMAPSMLITEGEITEGLERLERAMAAVEADA